MVLVFWLLLLFGCAKLPEEEPCALKIDPPSLETLTSRAKEDPLFTEGDFPGTSWWELFEDEQLNSLILESLKDQPSLKAAEARLEAANQEAFVVRSSLFPVVGVSAQGAQQYFGKNGFFRAFAPSFPGRINEYTLELDYGYELDLWGKYRNLFRAALGEARAIAAEAAEVRIILSTSVALAYFSWQIEIERLSLLQRQREIAEHRYGLTGSRRTYALDNQLQELTAQGNTTFIAKQVVASEQLVTLTQFQLKALLGKGPDDELFLEKKTPPRHCQIGLPSHLSSNLLARRPDLAAMIARAEASAERVGAARTDFYPSINLMGLVGLDSVFFNKFFTWPSRTATAIPALNLPIFTGGRLRANLKKRRAEFTEAMETYHNGLLQALKQVADQITELQSSEKRLQLQESLVAQRKEQLSLTAKKYQEGISSELELLDADQRLVEERQTALSDLLQKLVTTLALIKALGGGFSA